MLCKVKEREMDGSAVVESDPNGPVYPLTKQIAAQQKQRRCLHCGDLFNSPGPGFRFCTWCKNYLHHNDQVDSDLLNTLVGDPHETQVRLGRSGSVDSVVLQSVDAGAVEEVLPDGSFAEFTSDENRRWTIVLPV